MIHHRLTSKVKTKFCYKIKAIVKSKMLIEAYHKHYRSTIINKIYFHLASIQNYIPKKYSVKIN